MANGRRRGSPPLNAGKYVFAKPPGSAIRVGDVSLRLYWQTGAILDAERRFSAVRRALLLAGLAALAVVTSRVVAAEDRRASTSPEPSPEAVAAPATRRFGS